MTQMHGLAEKMKIDYTAIKNLFGFNDKDISRLIIELSIRYPDFSYKDIFSIFKTTCENYHEKADDIEDSVKYFNSRYSGMSVSQIQKNYDPKANLHSTFIFRNFYRVIDQSTEWDSELRNDNCLRMFIDYKQEIIDKLRKNYRNQKLSDIFEVTCEFIELIEKKNQI